MERFQRIPCTNTENLTIAPMSYENIRDKPCVKRLKSRLALNCAEFHELQFQGVFIGPRVYEILPQMFKGGGGALVLGYVCNAYDNHISYDDDAQWVFEIGKNCFLHCQSCEKMHMALVKYFGDLIVNRIISLTPSLHSLIRDMTHAKMSPCSNLLILTECGIHEVVPCYTIGIEYTKVPYQYILCWWHDDV